MSADNPLQNAEFAVFENANEWLQQGHRALLYAVVRTWGSALRPIDSVMALRDDGRITGSVSGG